jgi:UDP-GlcNAc:undecaprenyl-phosphate/decaprenyl-phosphate GlcNAc-1-phosphate transferase
MLESILNNNEYIYMRNMALFVVITGLSVLLTFICRKYIRIMDLANVRSSHTGAIPRSGGIAIVLSFSIGFLIYALFGSQGYASVVPLWVFFLASLMIAIVSLYDDITNKAFAHKFIGHFIGVVILILFGLSIKKLSMPFLGTVDLGWWGYLLTILWVVGITNTFNFMDGINGLAAGTAVIVGISFTLITFIIGGGFAFHMSYLLAAAALGFLFWNFPKGSIFMGDVGSAFLGFSFGALALLAGNFDKTHVSFMVMPILFSHFILETFFTVVWRQLKGYKIHKAHKMHPYQLLTQIGVAPKKVTIIYYIQTLILALVAYLYVSYDQTIKGILLSTVVVLYFIYFTVVHLLVKKHKIPLI